MRVYAINTAKLFHFFSDLLELGTSPNIIVCIFLNAFNYEHFNKEPEVFQVGFPTYIKNVMGMENNLLPTQSSFRLEIFIF